MPRETRKMCSAKDLCTVVTLATHKAGTTALLAAADQAVPQKSTEHACPRAV